MKSSLNKSQVEDLLINVLRSPKVMPWKGSKVQFCCPVHGESHPSAGIDIDFNTEDSPDGHFQVFHCFEGNTKIITDKGVFAIKDLVGSECSIINGNGEWETTKFKSFGKQQLYKLVLTSNGHEKIIYTTSQHRWFVQKRSSTVFTQDLKVGQRLQRQWLKAPKKPVHTAKYSSYLDYTVKSVTPTLIWSDVYCCETSTHSFVLDGFILTGNCFSCGESGTIPWLVYKSLPDRFSSVKQAADFLKKRYDVSYEYTADRKTGKIKRYDEPEEEIAHKRHELPKSFIAPFKSGKETYQYFFDRGFDKNDMKQFLIGRDLENETVTIPVFWEDDTLAGVIGRYIDKNRPKNMRYKIYNFPKGDLIFPLNKLQVINNTIIGVEGMLDVIKLHKWGYPNAVAMMGDGMSKKQADLIADRCGVFIDLFDHDKGGETARKIARKRLGNRVVYLTPSYYPEKGKDPSEWGEIETVKVIKSASYLGDKIIPRL